MGCWSQKRVGYSRHSQTQKAFEEATGGLTDIILGSDILLSKMWSTHWISGSWRSLCLVYVCILSEKHWALCKADGSWVFVNTELWEKDVTGVSGREPQSKGRESNGQSPVAFTEMSQVMGRKAEVLSRTVCMLWLPSKSSVQASSSLGLHSWINLQVPALPSGYLFYNSNAYILIPSSSFLPPHPFPFGNHMFVFYVCWSVSIL